jgi:hypothetical protein
MDARLFGWEFALKNDSDGFVDLDDTLPAWKLGEIAVVVRYCAGQAYSRRGMVAVDNGLGLADVEDVVLIGSRNCRRHYYARIHGTPDHWFAFVEHYDD